MSASRLEGCKCILYYSMCFGIIRMKALASVSFQGGSLPIYIGWRKSGTYDYCS
jgi:hypothetical protein